MFSAEKAYPKNTRYLLSVINDMMELQHGKSTVSDSSRGLVSFVTQMYGFRYEYRFFVEEGASGCTVRLEMGENASGKMLRQAFTLMESMMADDPGIANVNVSC